MITDDVSFAGALEVINAGYTPSVGDSFVIITFDQRPANSTFGSLLVTGFGSGIEFSATYNPNNVTLNVTAVPKPETWALWLGGVVAVMSVVRRRRGDQKG